MVVPCRLVAGRAIAIHADAHCEQVYYGDTLATNENTSNSLSLYIQGTYFCFEYFDPAQAFNAYSQFPNLPSLDRVAKKLIHPMTVDIEHGMLRQSQWCTPSANSLFKIVSGSESCPVLHCALGASHMKIFDWLDGN
jgi:hypothetical protein